MLKLEERGERWIICHFRNVSTFAHDQRFFFKALFITNFRLLFDLVTKLLNRGDIAQMSEQP